VARTKKEFMSDTNLHGSEQGCMCAKCVPEVAGGNLDGFDRWMVKRQVEHAKRLGVEQVLARLRAQGYFKVAAAVAKEVAR
jgi:hypothetical protein